VAIFTVEITGVTTDPEVYGGLTAGLEYVGSMFAPAATAWLALSSSQQGQTLRQATLYLDRLVWDGEATGLAGGTATTLQWSRSGVFVDGVEVDSTVVPTDVVSAAFELAVLISAKPGLVSQVDQGSNLRMVGGGGAPSVEFFAPTSAARGTANRLPYVVQQLVGKYLASPSASIEGGLSGVGDTCSSFGSSRTLTLASPE
jgi:hypothetical protein